MYKYRYIGIGWTLFAPFAFLLAYGGFENLAILGTISVGGLTLLPNYDRRLPLLDHRGITHTVWFALLVGVFCASCGVLYGLQLGILEGFGLASFGFLLGSLSVLAHLIADAFMPAGVTPFAPIQTTTYTYDVIPVSAPRANYLLLGLGTAVSSLSLGFGIAL